MAESGAFFLFFFFVLWFLFGEFCGFEEVVFCCVCVALFLFFMVLVLMFSFRVLLLG